MVRVVVVLVVVLEGLDAGCCIEWPAQIAIRIRKSLVRELLNLILGLMGFLFFHPIGEGPVNEIPLNDMMTDVPHEFVVEVVSEL